MEGPCHKEYSCELNNQDNIHDHKIRITINTMLMCCLIYIGKTHHKTLKKF